VTALHDGYVQLIRGGEGGFFGVCMTCGPLPDDRATHQEAMRDVENHQRSSTVNAILAGGESVPGHLIRDDNPNVWRSGSRDTS
jgi:hypothetical protein